MLQLTAAYGQLVNGGAKVDVSLIDRIQDRYGAPVCAMICAIVGHVRPRMDGKTNLSLRMAREQLTIRSLYLSDGLDA